MTGLNGFPAGATGLGLAIIVGGGGGVPLQSRSARKELTVVLLLVSLPSVRLLLLFRRGGEGIGSMGAFLCCRKYGS